jgi:hypothetical protein
MFSDVEDRKAFVTIVAAGIFIFRPLGRSALEKVSPENVKDTVVADIAMEAAVSAAATEAILQATTLADKLEEWFGPAETEGACDA